MLDWESLFKRYVWDSQTTPYFTPVQKLTRVQADFEVLAFCMFMGVLFAVVALGALSDKALFGRSPAVGMYAFTVVSAAIIFNYTKHVAAAFYLAAAPLACLIFIVVYGFSGERLKPDSVIAGAIVLVLLFYAPRLIGVARAYPTMPPGEAPPPRRRLFK